MHIVILYIYIRTGIIYTELYGYIIYSYVYTHIYSILRCCSLLYKQTFTRFYKYFGQLQPQIRQHLMHTPSPTVPEAFELRWQAPGLSHVSHISSIPTMITFRLSVSDWTQPSHIFPYLKDWSRVQTHIIIVYIYILNYNYNYILYIYVSIFLYLKSVARQKYPTDCYIVQVAPTPTDTWDPHRSGFHGLLRPSHPSALTWQTKSLTALSSSICQTGSNGYLRNLTDTNSQRSPKWLL